MHVELKFSFGTFKTVPSPLNLDGDAVA